MVNVGERIRSIVYYVIDRLTYVTQLSDVVSPHFTDTICCNRFYHKTLGQDMSWMVLRTVN